MGYREKLEAARSQVEQAQGDLDAATRERTRRVREALHAGESPTRIAEWAGIARSRVYRIAAQPEE